MIPQTIEELNKVKKACNSIVNKRASVSAVATFVPFPGADIGTDILLMENMIKTINKKFGLSHEQIKELDSETRRKIGVLTTALGYKLVGNLVTKEVIYTFLGRISKRLATQEVAKYVPVFGQAVSIGMSVGAIKLLGNTHIEECYEVCRRIIEEDIPETA